MNYPRADSPVFGGGNELDRNTRAAGALVRFGAGPVRLVSVAVRSWDSSFIVLDDGPSVREFVAPSHELPDGRGRLLAR